VHSFRFDPPFCWTGQALFDPPGGFFSIVVRMDPITSIQETLQMKHFYIQLDTLAVIYVVTAAVLFFCGIMFSPSVMARIKG
jgi:hypothetical protein